MSKSIAQYESSKIMKDFVGGLKDLATNPDVDPAKMQQILDVQERIITKKAQQEFWDDLFKLKKELPAIPKRGVISVTKNGKTSKTPFARLDEDIMPVLLPLMEKYGFIMMHQQNDQPGREDVCMTTILVHRAGHREGTTFSMPAETSGYKNNSQSLGSARSYCKRYNTVDLFDLQELVDDDGGSAEPGAMLGQAEVKTIQATIKKSKDPQALEKKILDAYGVQSIPELPMKEFGKISNRITAYLKQEK